jgi:hypothetical protein
MGREGRGGCYKKIMADWFRDCLKRAVQPKCEVPGKLCSPNLETEQSKNEHMFHLWWTEMSLINVITMYIDIKRLND